MQPQQQNFRIQRWVVMLACLLFVLKVLAWILTRSVSILTDALESTVNVVSGFVGLYSLYVAAKPRDTDHPYGHGKAEFLSAAVEGTLIMIAGLIIIYESIWHIFNPQPLQQLDWGIALISVTAILNYVMGAVAISKGKKNQSLALEASGRHLQTDTYTTLGILLGIALIRFTGQQLIDPIMALLFSVIILVTGYKILRRSLAGIMDEADLELLQEMVKMLNRERPPNWTDLHNLRVIKYGSVLHIDCHLTVPWYLNVHEAHREIDTLSALIKKNFGNSIELFVHSDGCMPFSCPICTKQDCPVRQHPFQHRVEWTVENILSDAKHRLATATGVLDKTA
ncbi:cation diffusion facilitator family transporter [Flavihumibacter petaseus]|uniref:Putative CDF family transporter n=1 Tax=Flavihumibacter petaseus NBRC 106054 TaxID=1220578 RepID=A0A0E9MUW4_9BACT|nr:cation diffusion facilitator family transporter [Flavihumibacter petaseus]GAO41542.1 putative CDF family transporter [Flavihumibacter petaseus NBRC 106054]